MVDERFVVLAVAGSRTRWVGQVARWATAALLPVELVTAMDVAEARAVLAAGRPCSALLVDADAVHLDADLLRLARSGAVATLAVEGAAPLPDVDALGCTERLPAGFGPQDLLDALRRCATPVGGAGRRALATRTAALRPAAPSGPLLAVMGAGGAGSTTIAMALAQGLAGTGRGEVVLVDGGRRADHAVLQDLDDVIPGLPELVELHRSDRPDPDDVRALLRSVSRRGYSALPGLRRPGDWAALRPAAVAAAMEGLRRAADVVVVDCDPDVEDEASTGSADVEERHALTRTMVRTSDLLVVVGRPGVAGTHRLVRHLQELANAGADPARVVPVVNLGPRSPARRAALNRALHRLAIAAGVEDHAVPVVHVPRAQQVESAHRVVDPLPRRVVDPVTGAATSLLARLGPRHHAVAGEPDLVRPGSLGRDVLAEEVA